MLVINLMFFIVDRPLFAQIVKLKHEALVCQKTFNLQITIPVIDIF